ncbi:MAG: peptidyl-prolyl cis-trans isomerase [Rhizobacter sp.]|nr:peptidyl-prolyl cis-trans isomerase [Rhizobacter sp.]
MPSALPVAIVMGLALAAAAPLMAAPAAAAPVAAARPAAPFATVGDTVISSADYQRALAVAMRKKYYHAKPPEAEYAQFQREVGDDVVNRVLLLKEARRRGIEPDRERLAATISGYDAQYQGSANWQANREKMLAAVVPQLEGDSLLERLGKQVKATPEPDAATLRRYYDRHKDLFVEPEQVKLSVILLKVDPSSAQAVWNSAHEEAKRLHQRLRSGADFSELAKLHSSDRSAAQGGQMDYTHRGMLPEAVHGVVDALKPSELSEPVQLLEGVAILRLDGRRPASQRDFDQVKERAAALWRRDEAEARWSKLIGELRRAARIRIDESQYAPLPATPEKARAG